MRTASMVLGIIGGVLCILSSVILILIAAILGSLGNEIEDGFNAAFDEDFIWDEFSVTIEGETFTYNSDEFQEVSEVVEETTQAELGIASDMLFFVSILFFVGGVLGITGGAIVRRNHITAGILQLVSVFLGFITFPLFLVGGILALIPERNRTPLPTQTPPVG